MVVVGFEAFRSRVCRFTTELSNLTVIICNVRVCACACAYYCVDTPVCVCVYVCVYTSENLSRRVRKSA